ncbi:hypothetical protein ACFL0X_00860 [Nanoarchaeota archaeon]
MAIQIYKTQPGDWYEFFDRLSEDVSSLEGRGFVVMNPDSQRKYRAFHYLGTTILAERSAQEIILAGNQVRKAVRILEEVTSIPLLPEGNKLRLTSQL